MPIVAAVSVNEHGHPLRVKLSPVAGFTRKAIAHWARASLAPGCDVLGDGLGCFAGVIDAGCAHSYIVVGKRKPRELAAFGWVNTVLGNLKTMINGGYKAFDFGKYAGHYLAAFSWRFNGRFDLRSMFRLLLRQAASAEPAPERVIRAKAEGHD